VAATETTQPVARVSEGLVVTRLQEDTETAPLAQVSVGALAVTKPQEGMATIRPVALASEAQDVTRPLPEGMVMTPPPVAQALAAPAVTRHRQVDTETTIPVPLVVDSKKSVISPHRVVQDTVMTLPVLPVMVDVSRVILMDLMTSLVVTAMVPLVGEATPTAAVTTSDLTTISRWLEVM